MPWWFWIITHLWVFCIGIISAIYIHEGEWEDNNKKGIVFGIVLHIFAPISILMGISTFLWEEGFLHKLIEGDYRLKRFFESRKRRKEEKEQIENDLKEMEDNEDEWRIERLGIKLK